MKIILASASPRRRELLQQIGWEFEVKVSAVDEVINGDSPSEAVEELSKQKAEAVIRCLPDGEDDMLVIGADTIVVCKGQILGKPTDEEDAAQMLRMLQGSSHLVYTGVTFCLRRVVGTDLSDKEKQMSFHEVTKVYFYPMSDKEIREYIATREPMDKAGAYGIQGLCAKYIRGIEGDFSNVVGLPVGRLYQETGSFLSDRQTISDEI